MESIKYEDYVVRVFLDAIEAFDSVTHVILLIKLNNADLQVKAQLVQKPSEWKKPREVGESWSELQKK